MIGYKDQTWCASDCTNTECFRCFTQQERERAIKWWGGEGFPVAMADFSKDCPAYLEDTR